MADILKILLIVVCFWLLINTIIPKIIDFFVKRSQNKFLAKFFKSDPIMKGLIENIEQKIRKRVKFEMDQLPMLYSDYIIHPWGLTRFGKVVIPLGKDKAILPHDRDQQIYSLAHELIHWQEKDFKIKKRKKSCGHKLTACMAQELKTDSLTIKLLKEVGIEIGKQIFVGQKQEFWSERLKIKVDVQCEKCHQIIKQGECPELQKILECLQAISLESGLKLVADPIHSKKNGVVFFIPSFSSRAVNKILRCQS